MTPRRTLMLLTCLCAGHAAAQTNLALMTAPWTGPRPIDAGFNATYLPTATDGPGSPDLDLAILQAAGRFRPNPDAPSKLTFGYEFTHLDVDTSDAALPDRLTNAALAAGARLGAFDAFGHAWDWGASAGVGFASSNAFGDGRGWYALGSLFANTKLNDRASLMIGVDYDGNRGIFPDLPLPGAALTVRHSDTLHYTLGFPYSAITWTPDDRWTLGASVAGLAFGAEARYAFTDTLAGFAKYGGNGEAFHVNGDDDHRRLFYSARYVEAGVELAFTDSASFVLAGGYAFAQEFERGFDLRDTDTVRDLDDTGYFRLGGVLRF